MKKLLLLISYSFLALICNAQFVIQTVDTTQSDSIKPPIKPDEPDVIYKLGSVIFDLNGSLIYNDQIHPIIAGQPFYPKQGLSLDDVMHFDSDDNRISKEIRISDNESKWIPNFTFNYNYQEEQQKIIEKEKEKKDEDDADAIIKYERQQFMSRLHNITDAFIPIASDQFLYGRETKKMQAFEISSTEVTREQYGFFVQYKKEERTVKEKEVKAKIIDPGPTLAVPKSIRINVDWSSNETNTISDPDSDPSKPVSFLTWEECKEFCGWLSSLDSEYTYRLPYSYEWDYAASSGFTSDYPWPNSLDQEPEIDRYGNFSDVSLKTTINNAKTKYERWRDGAAYKSDVASYEPNDFGLYDMGGNVAEWLEDKSTDHEDKHMYKGGSFFVTSSNAKIDQTQNKKSSYYKTGERHYGIGFRMVRIKK